MLARQHMTRAETRNVEAQLRAMVRSPMSYSKPENAQMRDIRYPSGVSAPHSLQDSLSSALYTSGIAYGDARRIAQDLLDSYCPAYAVLREYAAELAEEVSALRYELNANRDVDHE